jgi:hypothetical protein
MQGHRKMQKKSVNFILVSFCGVSECFSLFYTQFLEVARNTSHFSRPGVHFWISNGLSCKKGIA